MAGGTPNATPARARKVLERVPGLLVVCHLGASDAPVTLRAMGGNEVGTPHPQFPGFQGGEVAFPWAGRAVATPSSRTWATLGPILRPGRARGLGSRQDLELNALDRRHLPDPPIIELPLSGRGPNALGQGVGQLVRLVVSVPVLWGDAVRVFLLMGQDPTDKDPAKSLRRQGVLVSKP